MVSSCRRGGPPTQVGYEPRSSLRRLKNRTAHLAGGDYATHPNRRRRQRDVDGNRGARGGTGTGAAAIAPAFGVCAVLLFGRIRFAGLGQRIAAELWRHSRGGLYQRGGDYPRGLW